MHTKKATLLILVTLSLFAGLSFTNCGQKKPRVRSATEKHYELKGKVVQVDKAQRLLMIAHEEIKDYMPAMTMPFVVRDEWVFEIAAPGNSIAANYIVDGAQSWLEDVVITEGGSSSSDGATVEGDGPKVGDEVPNYRLINQDGKAIRLHDYRGKVLALTFIYTRCPDPNQCTLMTSNFAAIDQDLQKRPELAEKSHLLSISFDPEYDTPKVLRSYGAASTGRYSEENFQRWEFASGSADEVKGIAKFFGFRYFKDSSSGEEKVVHALRTAVIGPDSKVLKVYRGNEWKPNEIVKEIESR